MKERPILFSAPMVRALLAGTKLQTRRIVKKPFGLPTDPAGFKNPYGMPGDQLWVRETFSYDRRDPELPAWYWADGNPLHGDWTKPKPSIHMPRWASRIQLEITDVRVERLQEISDADARAEGVEFGHITDMATGEIDRDAVEAYEALWEQINGAGSWDANPWAWVVAFKRVQP